MREIDEGAHSLSIMNVSQKRLDWSWQSPHFFLQTLIAFFLLVEQHLADNLFLRVAPLRAIWLSL